MAVMRQTDTVDVSGRWDHRLEILAKAARNHDAQALEGILTDVIDGSTRRRQSLPGVYGTQVSRRSYLRSPN